MTFLIAYISGMCAWWFTALAAHGYYSTRRHHSYGIHTPKYFDWSEPWPFVIGLIWPVSVPASIAVAFGTQLGRVVNNREDRQVAEKQRLQQALKHEG